MSEEPYNPLDKTNLGASITQELLKRDAFPLPPNEPFIGAGIYALYYCGNYEPYKILSQVNESKPASLPIYVGKAIPQGGRKGGVSTEPYKGKALHSRICQHAKSIVDAENLDINHFTFKYLLLDDIWIPLGENLLIDQYKPLWNKIVDGFGIHDPGKGRYLQARSSWDTIHRGRELAEKCKNLNSKTEDQIISEIKNYLENISS